MSDFIRVTFINQKDRGEPNHRAMLIAKRHILAVRVGENYETIIDLDNGMGVAVDENFEYFETALTPST